MEMRGYKATKRDETMVENVFPTHVRVEKPHSGIIDERKFSHDLTPHIIYPFSYNYPVYFRLFVCVKWEV